MRKKYIASMLIVILIILLWVTGILPSGLCILTANHYVKDKYADRDFKYSFVEYSSAHGEYFVHFADRNGNKLAIMTSPFMVKYDPLDPPG